MAAAHKRCSLVFVHKIDGILKIQCRIKMKKGRWNVPFHYELRFTDSGVILDFDPYSGVCGSFSKLNVKNKKLVQLSQIEKYSSTQFSVEDVTWIMCDGDKLLNIKSFKPLKKQNVTKGLFIPSMLDGQDNWSSCYNSSETMLSTKKLLNLFFEKYFE